MNTKTTRTKQIFVSNNRGMSLPVALLLGIVTTGVGLVVIAKTQTDKGKTVAQVNAVKSSTIAETGVNQYLDFLNNNRILLTYPSCAKPNSTGGCSDTTTDKSWSQPSAIVSAIPSSSTGSTCSKYPPNTNQTSSIANTTEWQKITGTGWQDVEGGQYKLVSYSYQPDPGVAANSAPGTGTLIIEGRTNASGSDASKTQDQTRIAQTQIAIKIPVNYVGFPALWTKDFKIGNNSTVYGDGWDSSGCVTGNKSLSSDNIKAVPVNPINQIEPSNNGKAAQYELQADVKGKNVSKLQEFPDLPNNNTYTPPTDVNVNTISACPYQPSASETFPRSGDKTTDGKIYGTNAPDNATYVYRVCPGGVDSIVLNASGGASNVTVNLGISGKETLNFYLDGNLTIGSKGNLLPKSTANGTTKTAFYIGQNGKLDVTANGNIGATKDPTALQFYVYAQDTGTINQSGTITQSVQLGGNGSLFGFVFAPRANAKVWGTSDLAGALWAKSYEGGGNGGVLQGIFDYSRLDNAVRPSVPTLGQATSWERKPVN